MILATATRSAYASSDANHQSATREESRAASA